MSVCATLLLEHVPTIQALASFNTGSGTTQILASFDSSIGDDGADGTLAALIVKFSKWLLVATVGGYLYRNMMISNSDKEPAEKERAQHLNLRQFGWAVGFQLGIWGIFGIINSLQQGAFAF